MGGQKNNSNDETTPDSNKKTTKLNNAQNCNSKIIEWIKSESFKNFFISFSWLGVIYLAFSRFMQQFYNIKEINWYIIIEIIAVSIVYLILIVFILLYQMFKVFNLKGIKETKEYPLLWVVFLIIGIGISFLLIFFRPGWPSWTYELIVFVVTLALSLIYDYFHRVKLSGLFLKLILLNIYYLFIIKTNFIQLLINSLHHLKK